MINRRSFAQPIVGSMLALADLSSLRQDGIVSRAATSCRFSPSYDHPTYGGAGAIYVAYSPCLAEGTWNTYELSSKRPGSTGKNCANQHLTLFFNGVMVHNRTQLPRATSRLPTATYSKHPPEAPFSLQAHVGPVHYRVCRLMGYGAIVSPTGSPVSASRTNPHTPSSDLTLGSQTLEKGGRTAPKIFRLDRSQCHG